MRYLQSFSATIICLSDSCPLGACVPCARFVNLFLRFVPQEHWLQNSVRCFQVIILHLCSRSGTNRPIDSIWSWQLGPMGKNRLKSLDDRTFKGSRHKPQIQSALHISQMRAIYTRTVCLSLPVWLSHSLFCDCCIFFGCLENSS